MKPGGITLFRTGRQVLEKYWNVLSNNQQSQTPGYAGGLPRFELCGRQKMFETGYESATAESRGDSERFSADDGYFFPVI
ncbi:MAG: hypothetical protein LBS49_07355, partial [Candidatus Accumulibacter sp.]|nr:hypothetical protein [Accumulibacter sp.]